MVFKKKRRFTEKQNRLFLKKYQLKDGKPGKGTTDYNGYQPTPIHLCKRLADSGVLSKESSILDIGCGSGIFVCYLLSKNYRNIDGIEIDHDLYLDAVENVVNVVKKDHLDAKTKIHKGDFFDFDGIDNYDVFYIFNSFNSEETYCRFFNRILKSVRSNKRKIKIVFLYVNAIARKALLKQDWLKRTKVIHDDAQYCNLCIKFTVYENII